MKKIIVSYRGIPQSPGWATGDSLCRAFNRLGVEAVPFFKYYGWSKGKSGILENADAVLQLEMADNEGFYNAVLDLGKPVYFWDFDTEIHQGFTADVLKSISFEKVFMANPVMAKKFGAIYLPIAVDMELFFPDTRVEKKGFALVGTSFEERVKHSKECGYSLVCNSYREEYRKRLSELEVSIHYFSSGGKHLVVNRVFESMACGTMLLAEYQPEMLDLFTENDVEFFSSPVEIIEKLYSLSKSERDLKAGLAYWKICNEHTWLHRAKKILEVIG
jgi:hypothetical protein